MRLFVLSIFNLLSFITIAQPPIGYYNNTANKNCAILKTALRDIITNGNNPQSYGSLWSQYLLTDLKPRTVGSGSVNVIWDIYSSKAPNQTDPYQFTPGTTSGGQQDQGSGGSAEGQFYNREHSVPQSWFSGSTSNAGPATDYHHIFPTDKYVNAQRGNFIYGVVNGTVSKTFLNDAKLGTSNGFSGTVYEPINEFKGDVARAFLYFVTRYEDNISGWSSNNSQAFANNSFPAVPLNYLQLMLNWHSQDPVSQKERDRNNGGYNLQGNRNPYVDSPQYVNMVWNNTCNGLGALLPVDFIWLSGTLENSNIHIQWQVSNEVNVKEYVIEKSSDGIHFNNIGTVAAQQLKNYHLYTSIANETSSQLYYRVQSVDNDGTTKYSKVLQINVPAIMHSLAIYPNPASNYIVVKTPIATAIATIVITNIQGKKLMQVPVQHQPIVTISVAHLPKGMYTVEFLSTNYISREKLLIQ